MGLTQKTLLKATLLLPLAGLLMGNSSCEKKETTVKARELKKIVEMGQIAAQPLVLPGGGGSFDFKFVANQMVYGVLSESDGFTMRYNPPLSTTPTGAAQLNMSSGDQALYNKMIQKSGVDPLGTWSNEASCMVNWPMARLYGSINSFELVSGGGITIGYTPTGSHAVTGVGGSLMIQSAQLDMSMIATYPITHKMIPGGSVNVTAKQTKTNLSATINFGLLAITPSYFHQTPLTQVVKNGLTKAVTQIKAALKKEQWYTRVIGNHDGYLSIIGGRDMGLMPGDELKVYNELYKWTGEPCASEFEGGFGNGKSTLVAVIRLETVGDELSIGKVIRQSDYNAVIGAKVMVRTLIDPNTTQPPDDNGDDDGLTPVP